MPLKFVVPYICNGDASVLMVLVNSSISIMTFPVKLILIIYVYINNVLSFDILGKGVL